MALVNRIVNILILVASIAAVVFSYMLFSKREKLTNGWSKMATAIHESAKTIDDNNATGTAAAKELSKENLTHTQYDSLDKTLPKLKENTAKLVKQRNDMAEIVQEVGQIFNVQKEDRDLAKLKNITTFQEKKNKILGTARSYIERQNQITDRFIGVLRNMNVAASRKDFSSQSYASKIQQYNSNLNKLRSEKNDMNNALNQLFRTFRQTNTKAGWSTRVSQAINAHNTVIRERNQARNSYTAEKNKNNALQNQLKQRDRVIQQKNAEIGKISADRDKFKRILTADDTKPLPSKETLSPEDCMRDHVKGKITYIDKDYGFVTINIGKNYYISRPYGIKTQYIPFALKKGMVMTVARGLVTDKPTYVGKVYVSKIQDETSICNLLAGKASQYKVGDDVYFDDKDIAENSKIGKK